MRVSMSRMARLVASPVVISAVAVVAFFIVHMVFLDRAHPDALYMDSLRLLYQIQEWQQGRMSFVELWGLGSVHRGFINQIALLANVKFFSLDVLLANRLTGVVVALVAFILVFTFNRQARAAQPSMEDAGRRFVVSMIIVGLCFSWAGFELFTLDLGFPLWTKNLSFVLYFVAHSCYLAKTASGNGHGWATAALSITGSIIVLFVGMGWSYAFAGALVAMHALVVIDAVRSGSYRGMLGRSVPMLVVLASLAISLSQGDGGGNGGDEESFSRLLGSVPSMVVLVLHALGSSWTGVEVFNHHSIPLEVAAVLGLFSLLVAVYGVWRRWSRGLYTGSLLPFYLMAYGALTAASVAAARGEAGAGAVMASRYYMDLVLFQVGVIWLLAEDAGAWRYKSLAVNSLLIAYLALVIAALAVTFDKEWKTAPYRAANFEAMNRAILQGVPEEADAQLLQAPLDHARLGAKTMRDLHLGLFVDASEGSCDVGRVARLDGWSAPEDDAVWMAGHARMIVPPCGCDLVARLYLPAEFSKRALLVHGASGNVIEMMISPGEEASLALPASPTASDWEISVSQTTVPARDLPGGQDVRELGVLWSRLEFLCSRREVAR